MVRHRSGHNLKLKLNCSCYILRIHAEEQEKNASGNFMEFCSKYGQELTIFGRGFRMRTNESQPYCHTVTLVIRVWLRLAGSSKKRKQDICICNRTTCCPIWE